jgi:ATP adenylyltransferase
MTKIIWAPWRMEYILGEKPEDCIFCLEKDEKEDRKRLVLYRSALSFVIMNRYPYNNGHIMIAPLKHLPNIEDLDTKTAQDMFQLLQKSIEIIRICLKPEGFNIGVNIGKVGGAGIEEHLHIHIVPRWNGDTNFMPVLGAVRVMPEHLEDSYNKLYPYFKALKDR